MALKVLMARKKIDLRKKALQDLRDKLTGHAAREEELENDLNEVETEEQRTAVEEAIATFEAERDADQAAADALEEEIEGLEEELREMEEEQESGENPTEPAPEPEERGRKPVTRTTEGVKSMRNRIFAGMNQQERDAFFAREDVKNYLGEIRTAIAEKRAVTNAGLTIPEVMLGLIRHEIAEASKLLRFVAVRNVGGKARQNIAGAIPEGVWTEMCANLNELSLSFNQVEVDGYKVGGYIAICNAVLEDSDYDLAAEIVSAIGGAIAKALDKAILFGTGTKMPVGIATRLAQTSQPASWGSYAPAWTDLHTSNIKTLNIGSETGAAFFASLIENLGIAKDWYKAGGLFWVMNRKTHIKLMIKALAFNSNAALVANTEFMPILGGTIVEFEDDQIADNEIIGGYGGNYLLAERAGVEFASSDIPLFLQDQTVFKGTARYDGMPVAGEAFVIVNFANTSPTTTKSFPVDYANAELNTLTLVAAVGGTSGKTVVTATDYLASESPTLKYKVGKVAVEVGDALPAGFEDLTSGTTNIVAAAGKIITVVELDAGNKIVSAGYVESVPKS